MDQSMGADQYVLNPDSIAAEAINELTLEPDQSDRADQPPLEHKSE